MGLLRAGHDKHSRPPDDTASASRRQITTLLPRGSFADEGGSSGNDVQEVRLEKCCHRIAIDCRNPFPTQLTVKTPGSAQRPPALSAHRSLFGGKAVIRPTQILIYEYTLWMAHRCNQ